MAKGLLEKGARITLLTFPHQRWPIQHPNLTIFSLGFYRTNRFLQAWSFEHAVTKFLDASEFEAIISLDKVSRFTHLHAGGGTHKTFLKIKNEYAGLINRIWRKFSVFHRYIVALEKKGFQNPILQKIRCNSNMVKSDIESEYDVPSEKLIVLHSGIRWKDMESIFLNREEIGKKLRIQHRIDPRWDCLLFLGSGFDRKGLDISIHGLAGMSEDFHLVVVGKGPAQPYIQLAERLKVGHRIHFLGAQPQGWRFASFCKALVLPSYYDPFGGASAEGNAMGIPVLVSDKTGYADWISDGQNGIIMPSPLTPSSAKASFAKLAQLIEQPRLSAEQIRSGVYDLDDDVISERLMREFLQSKAAN